MSITTEVNRGILFLKFDGVFDNTAFNVFNEEIDYLLYKQGVCYYTFDFSSVLRIEEGLLSKLQSKLIEIFLNWGRVVMYGLNNFYQERIGSGKNRLYYVDNRRDAFNLLNL